MSRFVLDLGAHRVRLTSGLWRLGRDPTCEIHLADEAISRRHAALRVEEEVVTLEDHGSRNGVRVNGARVQGSRVLEPGDEIAVGSHVLRLAIQDPNEAIGIGMPPTRPLPKPEKPRKEALSTLSPRERIVFEQVARGKTQREVAEQLGVSVKTVETYRSRIGDKLNLRTRAELIEYALEVGVLRAD